MSDSEVVERLDRLIAIVSLTFESQIRKARESARADPTVAALLDHANEWVSAGELKSVVAAETRVGEKTVERRIVDLVERSGLAIRGAGPSRQYKRTGVL
jgi:hypothetical protein